MSELTETELTNQETFETGERFQFVAFSSSWKNQRRKRRQLAREQQRKQLQSTDEDRVNEKGQQSNSGTGDVAEKRRRLDENQEAGSNITELVESDESPPVLHVEFSIQSKTVSDLKAIVVIDIAYLNGTLGLNGVYEILQYIQNKWSP